MPTLLKEAFPASVALFDRPRKLWTRRECESLQTSGVDLKHLELIDGELFEKMPKNRPHSIALKLLLLWLQDTFSRDYVEQEVGIDVAPADNPTSAPEPDLVVLKRPSIEFPSSSPQPADIALVVEVSESTLTFDLRRKASLYARAGIQEYWVLDLVSRRLIVHCLPEGEDYSSVIAYAENESVAPLAAASASLAVTNVLPPRS
jgi:Uma2 family endonuclease